MRSPSFFHSSSVFRKRWFLVLASIFVTLLVTLLVANFSTDQKKLVQDIQPLYAVEDAQFLRSMGAMLGPQIVDGNRFDALLNGDKIFPAMLGAIRTAKKTITFETYIYWSGKVGKEFAEALAERARAGVKVHVLLDWVGSGKLDEDSLKVMEEAGVEVRKFNPLRWYNLGRVNNRTHRKLLVVDGEVGFTGGVGIAEVWAGNAEDPQHWRDSHFRVRGPVVAQMQSVLLDNWTRTTGKVLHGPEYFPALQKASVNESGGTGRAQMFSSSPTGGSESMHLMYLMAITAARKSILLSSSYFVPDEQTRDALVAAMKRGVKLRIITPGEHIDTKLVRRSSRGLWGDLLRAGAEMHEYAPTMYHCKVMVVDGLLVSVGSTNFDDRSFRLNDEANLNIYDAQFARQQTAIFEDDIKQSRRISYEKWSNRPLSEKIMEHLAGWLGPLL